MLPNTALKWPSVVTYQDLMLNPILVTFSTGTSVTWSYPLYGVPVDHP